MTFNIKSERVRLGLSQEDAAEKLGVHVNTLRMWERGDSVPNGMSLAKMIGLYGCSADYLLGITEERIAKEQS